MTCCTRSWKKQVDDAWVRLDCEQLMPWVFMTAGPPFSIRDFYGRTIAYQGVEFVGSPQSVFWSRYVEPFLESIVDKVFKETLRLTEQKNRSAASVLLEVAGLLKPLARRAYARMAEIDRRLRGKGFPQNVSLRKTESEQLAMDAYIDQRVAAELALYKPKWRINTFFNEHPFLFWFITLVASLVATVLAG